MFKLHFAETQDCDEKILLKLFSAYFIKDSDHSILNRSSKGFLFNSLSLRRSGWEVPI